MSQKYEEKNTDALVIGSTGMIGIRAIERLLAHSFRVHAVTTSRHGSRGLEEWFSDAFQRGVIMYYRDINAYVFDDFLRFEDEFKLLRGKPISCIVFCLALGPQKNFMESIPLNVYNTSEAMWDGIVEQYIHYFSRVLAFLSPLLDEMCDIVFITSGIADLEHTKCPPWLTSDIYQIGKDRLDSFIKYLREGVKIPRKKVCYHRIGISSQQYLMGDMIPCAKLSSYQMVMESLTRALDEVLHGEVEVDYDFVHEFNPAFVAE